MNVDIHPGAYRSPSVVATAASPGYPCGGPLVPGDPCPPVVIVPIPPSVVERSPSPRVVRYPHISMIGHHPVTVGGVRMKVPPHTRYPYTAVRMVVDPPAVRPQLVIKYVEVDTAAVVVVLLFVITVIVVSLRIHVIL